MKRRKCIVCDNGNKYPFCSPKCRRIALDNPEVYIKKIEDIQNKKKELLKKIGEYKDDLDDVKYERGEYVLRKLNTKNKTGDAYGITLPKSIHKKYYRYICGVKSNGVIVLIPKHKNVR